MSERGSKGNGSLVVALDGDKLGQIGGMAVAIIVMATCFFWRETDAVTALLRTGWAFTIAYGAIFLLVRVILRTTLFELVEQERTRKPKGRKARPAAPAIGEPLPGSADLTLGDLGLQPLTPRSES